MECQGGLDSNVTDPILTPCPQHDWPALDLCPYCLQTELAVLRSAVKLGTSMIDDLTRERDVYRHRVKDLENTRAAQEAAMELVCAEGVRLRAANAALTESVARLRAQLDDAPKAEY